MNNKLYFAALSMAASVFLFSSCNKQESQQLQEDMVQVVFTYTLSTSNGREMVSTKTSHTDVWNEFYQAISNGSLIAPEYTMTLTEKTTGGTYSFSGKWNSFQPVSVKSGTYIVTGQSTAFGDGIHEKCSILFEDVIDIEGGKAEVAVKARCDCSLLVFTDSSIKSLSNFNGETSTDFFTYNSYRYGFINSTLYLDGHKSEAYINGESTDGSQFIIKTGVLSFDDGKYYIYDNIKTSFLLEEMEEGNGESAESGICITANAGDVRNLLATYNCEEIKSLTISGHIDARDFGFIKWNCLNLENIDLSNVVIDRYCGADGTNEGYTETYAANEIPLGAFFYWMDHREGEAFVTNEKRFYDEGMPSLKSVKLPTGITAIRRNAFARAYNLTEINIPEGVECVDYVSFRYCTSLAEITLPSTLKQIGRWAFTSMPSLKVVHCKANIPPETYESFGTLFDADGRGSVYTDSYNTDRKFDTLYVPKGCKQAYASWSKYFTSIIEE